jgi:hypothetical protein
LSTVVFGTVVSKMTQINGSADDMMIMARSRKTIEELLKALNGTQVR